MARDQNCVFCKIAAGQIPSARVLETDAVLAFLDINPVAPGHVLLMPRDHSVTVVDMSPQAIAAVAAELPRLARAVLAATGAPALNVLQNNGREAGQLVNHVHFHLIPRRAADEFHIHWPHGHYAGNSMEDMRARIAAAL